MVATGRVRGPRAKNCRSRRRARKPETPVIGRSFVFQINVLHICRIPLFCQMNQIAGVNRTPEEISMTLQERLDAFKADFIAGKLGFKPTPERLDAMARATAELVDSGQAQK